jgi:hypothetical protein
LVVALSGYRAEKNGAGWPIWHCVRSRPRLPSSWPIAPVIVERNSGIRLEARFAPAAEHPDHDAYERSDEDKKIDCLGHGIHLAIVLLRASGPRPSIGSLSDLKLPASENRSQTVRQLTEDALR